MIKPEIAFADPVEIVCEECRSFLIGRARGLYIILRQIPLLDDGAALLHISKADGICAVLDAPCNLLVIPAVLKTSVPQLLAVFGSQAEYDHRRQKDGEKCQLFCLYGNAEE